MSKVILNNVTNIDSISTINDNFDKLESVLQDKVLFRDNPVGEPNTMNGNLDLNGFDVINVGKVKSEEGTWATVDAVQDVQDDVTLKAAQVSSDKAATIEAKEESEAILALMDALQIGLNNIFLGPKPSDPTVDNYGGPLQSGSMYFRTTPPKLMRVYSGSSWQDVGSISSTTTTSIDPSLYASTAEAQAGVNDTKVLTSLKTLQAIESQVKQGFTSSGPIVLTTDASSDMQVTTKRQTDTLLRKNLGSVSVGISGGSMTLTINPETLEFRSGTLSSSTVSTITFNSPISLVVPIGATLGVTGLTTARIAWGLMNNGGTLEPFVCNVSNDFLLDESKPVSTTALDTSSDSASVVYSANARTGLPFRIRGYCEITLITPGNWNASPTKVSGVGYGVTVSNVGLGFNQTWKDVTASRTIGTTYTNTDSVPIAISLRTKSQNSSWVRLTIQGVPIAYRWGGDSFAAAIPIFGIVPPGGTYKVESNTTLDGFYELSR